MIQLHIASGISMAQFLGNEKYFGNYLIKNLFKYYMKYIKLKTKEIKGYGTI
jgi:hypothetical protein